MSRKRMALASGRHHGLTSAAVTFLRVTLWWVLLSAPLVGASESTFLHSPALDHLVFTDHLLFHTTSARSRLHCVVFCAETTCCVAYTYLAGTSAPSGTGGQGSESICRGHAKVPEATGPSASSPGARTFYRSHFVPGPPAGTCRVNIRNSSFTIGNDTGHNMTSPAPSTNVALQKTAVQSSTWPNSPAQNAVDGNTGTSFPSSPCAFTMQDSAGGWWQVDLGLSHVITSVVIANRGDCCGWRLHDFDIHIYTDDPVTDAAAVATLCHHFPGVMPQGATEEFTCLGDDVTGRYVRITDAPNEHLQLCEVQVMGVPSDNCPA